MLSLLVIFRGKIEQAHLEGLAVQVSETGSDPEAIHVTLEALEKLSGCYGVSVPGVRHSVLK
jgi:hypothetical protein